MTEYSTVGLAAKMACAAYEDDPGIQVVGTYGGHASVLVVEHTKPAIVVAFRGSESLADWLVNAMRWKTPFTPLENHQARVHAGFMAQYTGLRMELFRHLMSHRREGLELIVTGHSLGGALATMFATELAIVLPQASVQCYSFNAPRVGNVAFVQAVGALPNLRVMRRNTTYDLVPLLLPWCGFVHTPDVEDVTAPPGTTIRSRHSMAMLASLLSEKETSRTQREFIVPSTL